MDEQLSPDTVLLTPLTYKGDLLPPNWGCSAASVANKIFVFGGYRWANIGEVFLSSLYEVDTHARILREQFPKAGDPSPEGRFGHGMVASSTQRAFYIFGGRCESSSLNDVWEYSIDDGTWTCLYPRGRISGENGSENSVVRSVGPEPRCWQCVEICNDCLIVCGGWNEVGVVLSDVWEFSLNSRVWRCLHGGPLSQNGPLSDSRIETYPVEESTMRASTTTTNASTSPVEPASPSAGSFSLVNRGIESTGDPAKVASRCSTDPKVAAVRPFSEGRSCACSCVHNQKLYLFGGLRSGGVSCPPTISCFDLRTLEWSRCRVNGFEPSCRISPASVLLDDQWYIHGGLPYYPRDGSSVEPLSDTVILNLTNLRWERVTEISLGLCQGSATAEIRRYGHAGCLCPSDGKPLFFAGAELYAVATTSTIWRMDVLPSTSRISEAVGAHTRKQADVETLKKRADFAQDGLRSLMKRLDALEADRDAWRERAEVQADEIQALAEKIQKVQHQQSSQTYTTQQSNEMLGLVRSFASSVMNSQF